MAALPPITQVSSCGLASKTIEVFLPPKLAGNHWTLFEGYWSQLDAQKTGKIDASTAATFLKKSQLKEPVLHKVRWPRGVGEGAIEIFMGVNFHGC